MAFKVDEKYLSDAAREYLSNAKSKAKAVRFAIEFFVNSNLRFNYIDIDCLECKRKKGSHITNDKPDNKPQTVTVNDVQIIEDDKFSVNEMPDIKNSENNAAVVNTEDKSNEEMDDELYKLAISSIENIVGTNNYRGVHNESCY